jgi:hypothetical protein
MRRSLVAAVVLAAAIVSGTLIARGQEDPRPTLSTALATLPDVTLTANFTDWGRVRETLDADDVTSDASAADRRTVLDAAYADDLSALSGLAGSTRVMADRFGWSVLDLDWEVFGQAREGAAIVARLGDAVDPGDVVSTLAELGYREPDAADDGGVWQGGPDLLARLGESLTPMLEHVAVVADERVVVLSDTPDYAARTVDVVRSGSGGLGDVPDVAATAEPLLGATTAVVHRPPLACVVTSYDSASAADRRLAMARLAAAGGVHPHRGLGFGIQAAAGSGLELVVSMHFESAAVAERDRSPRTELARGPAIGQGGTYDERFDVESSTVVGDDLVLVLRPVESRMSLVSDLVSGPLLFPGCGG